MQWHKFLLPLLAAVQLAAFADGQNRCSYVTVPVCDGDVTVSPGQLGAGHGPKGDIGPPGKMGPRGHKGQKGEVLGFEEFQAQVLARLDALEARLCDARCSESSVNGRQMLCGEEMYCEDGWTVFQRRFDGSVDFQLNWVDFSTGFGNLSTEFWLGLKKVHSLTKSRACRLRVDLWDFDDNYVYANYSSFYVGPESDNFRLKVSGYSGTAGDSLVGHNGMAFSSRDRDNDLLSDQQNVGCKGDTQSGNPALFLSLYRAPDHCVFRHNSGSFWYKACFSASLNAPWGRSTKLWDKIIWHAWRGSGTALKATTMKFRCD